MSSIERSRLGEDARFELAAAAGAHERRNRPVWLVGAAALLLAVVLVLTLLSLGMRARAVADLERSLEDQAAVELMVQQWRTLSDLQADPGTTNIGEPRSDIRSRLEQLATQAGFATPPFFAKEDSAPPKDGVVVRTYNYFNVKEPSLGTILEWLRLTTKDPVERIPGLEVSSLKLTPQKDNTWTMNLTLRRLERAG